MILGGIAAGVTAATGIFRAASGFFERRKSDKELDGMEAPDYRDSEAYDTAERSVGTSRRFMEDGIPDEIRNRREQSIDNSFAATLDSAGRGGTDPTAAFRQSREAYGGLASLEAQFKIGQRQQYLSSLDNLQKAQDKAYNVDLGEFKFDQARALGGVARGQENMNAGAQDIISAFGLGIESGIFGDSGELPKLAPTAQPKTSSAPPAPPAPINGFLPSNTIGGKNIGVPRFAPMSLNFPQ